MNVHKPATPRVSDKQMRRITTREKAFLGIGALATVVIFIYFIFWPMLQGEQSGAISSLEEVEERLESVKALESMETLLVGLEERMRSQSGYGGMSFKRGIADSMIITYLAEAAKQADIKDLEQLDAKPDTTRKTQTEAKSDKAILRSTVHQLYLCQVMDEMERLDEAEAEGMSSSSEVNEKNLDVLLEMTPDGSAEVNQPAAASTLDMEQAELEEQVGTASEPARTNAVVFPLLPGNIPDEVRRRLARWTEAHQGQTIGIADINNILEEIGLEDEKEEDRVRKRLQLYRDRIRERKDEVLLMLSKLGISQNARMEQKADEFSVKMVFKSRMDQLVKLLYNLQNSAKWLRVEGMRVTISDRKETLLSVELSMTATTLYD